jgi:WD40 repeat protein
MGVIHRDLKPANILVEPGGSPKVLDFGVARPVGESPMLTALTEVGQIIGTLSYMSPEQIEGQAPADTRFDVYALGVLLYQLLAGQLPIDLRGQSLVSAAKRIAEEQAPKLGTIRRELRGDIEAVVDRALSKRPADRYSSVEALAADLQRVLDGRPVRARSASAWYVARTNARRYRKPLTAAVVAVAVLVAFSVYSWRLAGLNERQADELRRTLYSTNIGFAHAALQNNDVLRVAPLLQACPETLRGWEWHYLSGLSDQSLRSQPLSIESPRFARRSEDRRIVALAGLGRQVEVIDTSTGLQKLVRTFAEGTTRVDITPDGRWVAFGAYADAITLMDLQSATESTLIHPAPEGSTGFQRRLRALAFTRDGSRLAVAAMDGRVMVFDLGSREVASEFRLDRTEIHVLRFDHAGTSLFLGDRAGRLRRFGAATGELLDEIEGHEAAVSCIDITPDGQTLITGDLVGNVILWDAATGERLWQKRLDNRWITSATLNPAGTHVAVGCADASLVLFDRATRFEIAQLRGHFRGVVQTWYDEDRLTTVGLDGTIRTWLAEPRLIASTIESGQLDTLGVRFLPDSGSLVTTGTDGTVQRWDARSLRSLQAFERHDDTCYAVDFDRTGSRMVSSSRDLTLRVWDVASGRMILSIPSQRGHVLSVAMSPDGSRILAGDVAGGIQLFDAASGALLRTWSTPGRLLHAVRFHPDGRHFITGGGDGFVRVWTTDADEPVRERKVEANVVYDVAYTPDFLGIVYGGESGTPGLLDADMLSTVRTFSSHNGGVFGVAVHPQGRRLATCGIDRTVRIWDLDTGYELLALRGHQGLVQKLAFSPDGRTLASTSDDGTVRLWSGPR